MSEMKRTVRGKERTAPPKRLPDAIQLSPKTNFTQIKNDILRDESISYKAKGILCALLANESGKWKSYQTTLENRSTDGTDAVRSGLKELEEAGYLIKVLYVDKNTKRRKGSFWAYTDTPWHFEMNEQLNFLEENNLEVQGGKFKLDFPDMDFPDMDGPNMGNQSLKIPIIKNINNKEEKNIYSENCKKVYNHWIDIASHINNARYTKNLEKKITTKLKNWPLDKILQAISNYVQIYDSDFYYSHAFTLYAFIEQGNGAPRFVKGLDEKYDGDIWQDYTTTTTSPSPTQPSNGETPKKILRRHFGKDKDTYKIFHQDCFAPAKSLFSDNGKADESKLAHSLVNLYDQIQQQRNKNLSSQLKQLLPGPISIIENYITWIEDNHWITNITSDMFHTGHALFGRYRREEAKRDNAERDPLTGYSYIKG